MRMRLNGTPLVLQNEGERLVIRLVSDFDQNSMLLEEHSTTKQPQSLAPCGLSLRKAQVLVWLAQGTTKKEIGVILKLQKQIHMFQHQNIGMDAKSVRFFQTIQ
jgi:hypothetical protein